MNKKFFFWIIVLLIPVLLVPPFVLHVSKFGAVGIQHAFITDPPNFSEGISASTLFVEILAVLLIAFVLSKVKDKTIASLRSALEKILFWSIIMAIGLFTVSEIIKYQKIEIREANSKTNIDSYRKALISNDGCTDAVYLKAGFSQDEIDAYRKQKEGFTNREWLDMGATQDEIDEHRKKSDK